MSHRTAVAKVARTDARHGGDTPVGFPAAPAAVILAGVAAALHVGKLPPAITALQQALGLSLVQAGFLLSLVQLAGAAAGVAFGVFSDGLGARRGMLVGLVTLGLASVAGGFADSVGWLMVLRAVEGCGFLLVVLPGPGLVRRHVDAHALSRMMGAWSSYMPLATALALLCGPWAIGALGWRGWWWGLALVTVLAAVGLAHAVPPDVRAISRDAGWSWIARMRLTLSTPATWLVAACFACYAAQWLAVVGFLPTMYGEAGINPALSGALTALVAAVNILGNLAGGRLLQRGHAPARLLAVGYTVMLLAGVVAFAALPGVTTPLRYGAVLALSIVGGLIPSTLFSLAVRAAPSEGTLSTTVGWMQQGSACGQLLGPPLVAWIATHMGGWQWTWLATGACACAGLLLSVAVGRWHRRATAGP